MTPTTDYTCRWDLQYLRKSLVGWKAHPTRLPVFKRVHQKSGETHFSITCRRSEVLERGTLHGRRLMATWSECGRLSHSLYNTLFASRVDYGTATRQKLKVYTLLSPPRRHGTACCEAYPIRLKRVG